MVQVISESLFILFKGTTQVVLVVKNPANAGDPRDMGSIPGSGRYLIRSLRVGNGNPFHYSSLKNPMDCCVSDLPIVRGVAKNHAI